LNDHSAGTNPLFDQIEQCEFLKRYCQKKINAPGAEDAKDEGAQEAKKQAGNNDLEKALAKGSIALAPSKEEKLAASVMSNLVKKGKKSNKKATEGKTNENQIDFQIIKKFNNLKLSVPMKSEDYPKTIEELDQLREALVYWGKIM
jgi:hypothetical protein